MPKLTFVSPSGERMEFDVKGPSSAMHVARLHGVDGIEAECGGALACGTCHVYVEEQDVGKLPAASESETEMLDLVAADRKSTSRLCCQIEITESVENIVLHIPETQF